MESRNRLGALRHFARAVANFSSWVGKDRAPQTSLQRSLRVFSELFVRNKELKEERKGLKEFGILEMAEKVKQKEQLQQQQQQIVELQQQMQQLQQQLQQEQEAKKKVEEELQTTQQELVRSQDIAWRLVVNKNDLTQKCNRLEIEVLRARRAEESLRTYIEDSITSFNELNP